jgi:hypothetical protein
MSRIVIVILIYHRHKPVDSINLFYSLYIGYPEIYPSYCSVTANIRLSFVSHFNSISTQDSKQNRPPPRILIAMQFRSCSQAFKYFVKFYSLLSAVKKCWASLWGGKICNRSTVCVESLLHGTGTYLQFHREPCVMCV